MQFIENGGARLAVATQSISALRITLRRDDCALAGGLVRAPSGANGDLVSEQPTEDEVSFSG
jgi:hypothetical protein